MIVKNLNNTAKNKCKCGKWFKHWKKFSKMTIKNCVVVGCQNIAEHGGHVQIGTKSNEWFIIPICRKCNAKKGEYLNIDSNIVPVPANVSKTCGKKNRILIKPKIKKPNVDKKQLGIKIKKLVELNKQNEK